MREELEALMQEPAGGENHGRARHERRGDNHGVYMELGCRELGAIDLLVNGGFHAVDTARGQGISTAGSSDAGMSSHIQNQHTVLHPDEYVDAGLLAALVEDELGYSVEQLRAVYSTGGRIPSDRRPLRDLIDARLLALSRGGANMDLFGRVTGLNGSTLDRAIARAKEAE